jgi:hypothetical protein
VRRSVGAAASARRGGVARNDGELLWSMRLGDLLSA